MNSVKEKMKAFFLWMKKNNVFMYVLSTFALMYLWIVYGEDVQEKFDLIVLPKLALLQSNAWLILFTIVVCVVAIVDIIVKFAYQYCYSPIFVYCVSWILAICLYYQSTGDYQYLLLCSKLSYFNVFIGIGFGYVSLAVVNWLRILCNVYVRKDQDKKSSLVGDWPIEKPEDDVLGVADEARDIADRVMKLSTQKTWSIAITAAWGIGKTSFLKLITGYLFQKKCDIMFFNPRDCKSYEYIQTDFFSALAHTMSKYDARCSNKFRQYMSALQLIDDRGIIKKILNFYDILDKKSIKSKLVNVFSHTNNRIVVVIDDFDRLNRLEIMEVLKIIDANADFTNLIFITAYDKNQVNLAMGNENNTKDASFVDKFFHVEYPIPIRPYSYILKYIIDVLICNIECSKAEKDNIKSNVQENECLLKKYIPTIRDVKRFLNQFLLDYKFVQKEVDFADFFLLHLVKYRYYDEYKNIFDQVYLNDFSLYGNFDLFHLDDKASTTIIYDVLQKLFPALKESRTDTYKHICEKKSFGNYFLNHVYSAIKLEDLNTLFADPSEKAICDKVNAWLAEGDAAAEDLLKFLMHFDNENIKPKEHFMPYSISVAYLAAKSGSKYAFWLLMRLLYNAHLEKFKEIYKITIEDYVRQLLSLIEDRTRFPQLELIKTIHRQLISEETHLTEFAIDDSALKTLIETQFNESITKEDLQEQEYLTSLYSCVESIEAGSRKVKLMSSCCEKYREYLNTNPGYYISHFVFFTMPAQLQPDYNSVACEAFWKQIFKDEKDAQQFIQKCIEANLPGASAAEAFFPIYVANNYQPVEFHGQGNVEAKFRNNFADEKRQLEDLQHCQQALKNLPLVDDQITVDKLKDLQNTIDKIISRLDDCTLYIKLRGDLYSKATSYRKAINDRLS